MPDLSAIDAEFRTPHGDIPPGRLDEWAEKVSEAYPTLEPEDVLGIWDYTTNSYTEMNGYLRDLSTPSDVPGLETRLNATTAAISSLRPVPGVTYRGMEIRPGLLDQFTQGGQWSDPAFISSSTSSSVADNFGANGGIKVTITGRSGVDVGPFSRFQKEDEILFQRGVRFDVVRKEEVSPGVWEIDLTERT